MMIGLLLCMYFSYHLIHGERSLVRLVQTQEGIRLHQALLKDVSGRRAVLEAKVVMMRPGSVDRDLLEERIQSVLGYVSSDDLVLVQ